MNNAGTIIETPAVDTAAPQMRGTFEVNVFGVVTAVHTPHLTHIKINSAARLACRDPAVLFAHRSGRAKPPCGCPGKGALICDWTDETDQELRPGEVEH